MAKQTAKYETIFIVDVSGGEEQVAETVAKFKALIEEHATLASVEPSLTVNFGLPSASVHSRYIASGARPDERSTKQTVLVIAAVVTTMAITLRSPAPGSNAAEYARRR